MGEKPEKLVLPNELPLCGTCSYWDGERKVDEESQLVVLTSDSNGTCLVTEKKRPALFANPKKHTCLWEDLNPAESPESLEQKSTEKKIDFQPNNKKCNQ